MNAGLIAPGLAAAVRAIKPTITVIRCRGIGEPMSKNTLQTVTDRLDPKRFKEIELVWSASFGPVPRRDGDSFGVSVEQAESTLLKLILDQPGPVVLIGYSGGAQVVGNVAARAALYLPAVRAKIIAVGMISDPSRHHLQIVGQDRGGQGIMTGRFVPADHFKVWQLSAWGDPISEQPNIWALEDLAAGIEFWSLKDPAAWMKDIGRKALAGRFRFWEPRSLASWGLAYQWSLGYTRDHRHTSYHVEHIRGVPGPPRTYTEHLAMLIGDLA